MVVRGKPIVSLDASVWLPPLTKQEVGHQKQCLKATLLSTC